MTETSNPTRVLGEIFEDRGFKLLVAFTMVTLIEAISYAWIEVLLYRSVNPLLNDTWIFGHYTTYHIVLLVFVLAMVFGVGFFGSMLYVPGRFRKFIFLSFGNLFLWLMLEDEFTFIFSGSPHTSTDWSNWPIGALNILGYYVPLWYLIVLALSASLWYVGLTRFD